MYATDFFERKILNLFNNTVCSSAQTLYVALFLSNPTESGVAGNEVNYIGYTRPLITFGAPYAESGGMGVKNENDILWKPAPMDIGQARYIGIYDSPTLGSGNMWLYGELTIPLDIKANQQPSVYNGDILYYMTGNFSIYLKTKILNTLRGLNLPGFTPFLTLFDGDPETSGNELSGGAYSRPSIIFNSPEEQTGGQMQIKNANGIKFPSPTSPWGLWSYDGINDAQSGGNLLVKMQNPNPEIIQKNYVPSVNPGEYKIMVH